MQRFSIPLFPRFCLFSLLFLSTVSCEKAPEKYAYHEITISDTSPEMFDSDPHAGLPGFESSPQQNLTNPSGMMPEGSVPPGPSVDLAWDRPEGWQEQAGSGMRLVTFVSGEGDQKIECSIVSLGGMAGGLAANVKRWLGQLNITLDSQGLNEFLAGQKTVTAKGGWPVAVVDFTSLRTSSDPLEPSMMAAVLEMDDKTLFVKMTGPMKGVMQNKQNFELLCQSLDMKKVP